VSRWPLVLKVVGQVPDMQSLPIIFVFVFVGRREIDIGVLVCDDFTASQSIQLGTIEFPLRSIPDV
jgi:hypothetical protein